ncbi:MAG: helix-turn-helix domain-containing protein [bacterium]
MKRTPLEKAIEELEEIFLTWDDEALYGFILEVVEKPLLEKLLERTGGDQEKVAKILHVDQQTIQAKIEEIKGLQDRTQNTEPR